MNLLEIIRFLTPSYKYPVNEAPDTELPVGSLREKIYYDIQKNRLAKKILITGLLFSDQCPELLAAKTRAAKTERGALLYIKETENRLSEPELEEWNDLLIGELASTFN